MVSRVFRGLLDLASVRNLLVELDEHLLTRFISIDVRSKIFQDSIHSALVIDVNVVLLPLHALKLEP